MADLAGANGQRENFKIVGKPNLPGNVTRGIPYSFLVKQFFCLIGKPFSESNKQLAAII